MLHQWECKAVLPLEAMVAQIPEKFKQQLLWDLVILLLCLHPRVENISTNKTKQYNLNRLYFFRYWSMDISIMGILGMGLKSKHIHTQKGGDSIHL